jgi:hypothetical protein
MVLQERDNGGNWHTKLVNIFHERDYEFFCWFSAVRCKENCSREAIAKSGYPQDFSLDRDEEDTHFGFYMGDHSHGYISLPDFMSAKTDEKSSNASFYQDCLKVLIGSNFMNEWEKYRLVFGYDN